MCKSTVFRAVALRAFSCSGLATVSPNRGVPSVRDTLDPQDDGSGVIAVQNVFSVRA